MITWLTAFLDLPAASFEADAGFWTAITRTTRSAPRGRDGELATLVPPDGDPFLRLQRVADGRAHLHLDVHTDDPAAFREQALHLGATPSPHGEPGLHSPG